MISSRHLVLATVMSAASLLAATPAWSQSLPILRVSPGGNAGAYVTDSQSEIVRSGTGLCVRTGSWSVAAAMATRLEQSQFSAGCACSLDEMPAGACTAPPMAQMTPPAPTPAAPMPAEPQALAEKVTIPADALFAFDKAALSSEGLAKMQAFMAQLKGLNLEAIIAVGHADRIGSPAYNTDLSERRAKSVKAFLVEQGVAAERVFSEGRGESEPVTGEACNDIRGGKNGRSQALVNCLAPDRRVVIEAVGSRAKP